MLSFKTFRLRLSPFPLLFFYLSTQNTTVQSLCLFLSITSSEYLQYIYSLEVRLSGKVIVLLQALYFQGLANFLERAFNANQDLPSQFRVLLCEI